VAGLINISRVAALLAANPRIPVRRIDVAIDPGSRDPGNHSGAGARQKQSVCSSIVVVVIFV